MGGKHVLGLIKDRLVLLLKVLLILSQKFEFVFNLRSDFLFIKQLFILKFDVLLKLLDLFRCLVDFLLFP